MSIPRTLFGLACRAAAFSFVLAGTAAVTQAQSAASTSPSFERPLFVASAYANPFADLASGSDLASSSSSSSSSSADSALPETGALGHFDLSAKQPPPRRRYGRPNYSDKNTNPDGSPKWTFMAGGGFTLPVGGTHSYASPSWKFQVGGGRNLNKVTAILLQFDYDRMGMQTKTLNQQYALYNALCGGSCGFNGLGGNVHDWSFTLNPTFTLPTEGSLGAYVATGAGFYHKVTTFTTPTSSEYCDPYYGCYVVSANAPVDWYTSNAFGLNAGLGVTWKFSHFSNERLYAEARYVWTDNSPRRYDVSGNTAYFNAFPQEAARTEWIPITFGIRF